MFTLLEYISFSLKFHLSKTKSYRRYIGGDWYKVWVKQAPYVTYWINKPLLNNEVVIESEHYHKNKIN